MIRIFRFITSLLVVSVFYITGLKAQSVVLPSAIRLGTDFSRLGIWALDPNRKQYEFNADVDVYKYFLTVDYGDWTTKLSGDNFNYLMNGWYFRTGIDYNFLFSDPDHHVIFFGLRYCSTVFDETLKYNGVDPYFGSSSETLNKHSNRANWYEMNGGLKVHIWKGLYMGWTGRLKFGLKINNTGTFTTYEVPGYGITSKNTNWGLNYSIYYRLAFRKKPLIKPKTPKNINH